MAERTDIAVVGAGIIGLATARALALRHPGLRVTVLDKENAIAQHQTGRSSGVIHRGVYYQPGSLKARLCVEGAKRLVSYCDDREIPVLRCGKVVVATTAAELGRLEELHRRAVANSVPRVEVIGPERLRELEPHVAGLRALSSPETYTVDFALVAAAFADDVRQAGGEIVLGAEVRGIRRTGGEATIETSREAVHARHVVVCAGVYADRLAVLGGAPRDPRIVPFRGDYLRLKPDRRHLSRGLVYPVPDPTFPFLGVHTTVRPDGDVWLGPNAVLAMSREGYRRTGARWRDVRDTVGSRGFRRLARRHWRTGAAETVRDWNVRLFVREARRLIPELERGDVERGPAGIRAQALAEDGTLVDDFVIHETDGVIHVRNAPSPGATSSLAIADEIVSRLDRAWDL